MDTKGFINYRVEDLEEKLQQIYNLLLDFNFMLSTIEQFAEKFGDSEEYEAQAYDRLEDLCTFVYQASIHLVFIHDSLYRELKRFNSVK